MQSFVLRPAEPGGPQDRTQAGRRAVDMAASSHFWAVALRNTGKVTGQLYLKQIEPAGAPDL